MLLIGSVAGAQDPLMQRIEPSCLMSDRPLDPSVSAAAGLPAATAIPAEPGLSPLAGETVTVEPGFFEMPRDTRSGMFQKLSVDGTWLAGGGTGGLGLSDLDARLMLALPAPPRQWPMVITPGWATHFLDAPGRDLPARVDDAYAEFRWLPRLSPRLLLDLTVTPGVYRDFEQSTGDGLRVTAHGAAVWAWSTRAKLVLGLAYLDRPDLNYLPIGGLMWNPDERWQLDLLFPQPKIARRLRALGPQGEPTAGAGDVEDWFYIAGEFGDWLWAIRREDGTRDTVAYRDCRLLLGLERRAIGKLDARIEVGYVFSRKLEYLSDSSESSPDGTLLLRGGLTY